MIIYGKTIAHVVPEVEFCVQNPGKKHDGFFLHENGNIADVEATLFTYLGSLDYNL